MEKKNIKVVIVEDSPVAREFLTYILTSDPSIQVVGVAINGAEALDVVREKHPDVITMDIHMPVMDGFEATRRIMETVPTPIVIVSASSGSTEVASTFRAIEAGALAIVHRPPGLNHSEFEAATKELIKTVKQMSEVKVVKKLSHLNDSQAPHQPFAVPTQGETSEIKLIAMGASTGGPMTLKTILLHLPLNLLVPVLIVQHISPGFLQGFTEWLSKSSGFPVSIAVHDETVQPGHGYVAPNGFHMGITKDMRIVLSDEKPESGLRPSVSYLFRSVARTHGPHAAAVLLTGMGRDGAEELKMLKDAGALTIVQDQASSVIFGMPGEAIKLDAAVHVLAPVEIANALVSCVKRQGGDHVERK